MSRQEAAAWVRNHLDVEHDTDGDRDCSICGQSHDPTTEHIPVEVLATNYADAMTQRGPPADVPAADVARDAIEAAEQAGTGHVRFFRQALDQ